MTTLTSIAEVSNFFSIVTVFLVFMVMVIFILRLHGEDFRMSNSSVTYIRQMPLQQTPMIKINNPFIFKLIQSSQTTDDVLLSISSQFPFILHAMWGVTIADLHTSLSVSWNVMRKKILEKDFLASSTVDNESLEFTASCNELQVCLSPPANFQPNLLGTFPRLKYPLIVILFLKDEDELNPLGAMINVIHIRDDLFQMPSCVLAQYLKMIDGQVTTLKPLYVTNLGDEDAKETESVHTPDEALCVVCQSEAVTRALLPCRHVCTCRNCFGRLDKCPMCRSHINSYFCIREEVVDGNRTEDVDIRQPVGWRQRYERMNEWLTQLFGLP